MSRTELRATLALSGIYVLRMLGLFMILPVFALHAAHYAGATPLRIGLALGAYGLTQALLQIPFGMLSDRFGRKPVILFGLLLFAAGSAVAALSTSMAGVILGRALQGAGAISAAVLALAADLTREHHRTTTMAVIGISIGVSFSVAFVIGPGLDTIVGLKGLFWVSVGLGLLAIAVLYIFVPDPVRSSFHRECEADGDAVRSVLRDPTLTQLDAGIFCLHVLLTATFVVLPIALRDEAGLPQDHHWRVYLPVLLASVALVVPLIRLAEGRGRMKVLFLGTIATLAATEVGLAALHASAPALIALLVPFFVAFNFLEASLPSLVSRAAPPERKGTALGVYATSQFLGIFAGGLAGGLLNGRFGIQGVFLGCAAVALAWLAWAWRMPTTMGKHRATA